MSKKNGSGAKKNGAGSGSHSASSGSPASAGSAAALKALPDITEHWSDEPEEHDFPAAAAYLSLVCEPTDVRKLVNALQTAPTVLHQAKDLLRASGLALLPIDNVHVASDLAKVDRGEKLSPVLLVRGDFRRGSPLTIADGYHRVCASYHLSENTDIPCHLVDYKSTAAVPGFRVSPVAPEGQ
jgi:hypothetical protein